jgi:hypothetical protein
VTDEGKDSETVWKNIRPTMRTLDVIGSFHELYTGKRAGGDDAGT